MTDPRSFERLRHGALAMLADGNSLESVAHLLEVPVDVVLAWRAHPEAVAPASAFVDTAPPPDEPAPVRDAKARVRFNDELVYASSIAMRATGLVMGIVLVVVTVGIVLTMLRGSSHDIGEIAELVTMLVVMGVAAKMMLGWSRRILVLGTDSVIVPGLFSQRAMAYSDVAGYALEAHTLRLDAQSGYKGRLLSLRSRRPGVEPLTVFLFDDYPVDRGVFERLDEVVRANRGAPPLPPLVGASGSKVALPAGRSLAVFAVMGLLGALQLWPIFSDSVHTLRRGTPPLSALRHVEGRVAAASKCWTRSRHNGGDQVISIDVAQASGKEEVIVPCVVDQDALLRHGPRRLAVDVDPDARPVPAVYQMSLDGRVLIAYDEARARRHHLDFVPALVGVLLPLAVVGLVLFGLRTAWMRSRGDAANA